MRYVYYNDSTICSNSEHWWTLNTIMFKQENHLSTGFGTRASPWLLDLTSDGEVGDRLKGNEVMKGRSEKTRHVMGPYIDSERILQMRAGVSPIQQSRGDRLWLEKGWNPGSRIGWKRLVWRHKVLEKPWKSMPVIGHSTNFQWSGWQIFRGFKQVKSAQSCQDISWELRALSPWLVACGFESFDSLESI